jgi:hypothetical protein
MNKKRKLAYAAGVAAGLITVGVGSCSYGAKKFDGSSRSIGCEQPNLPEVAGAEALTESICVSVSGEQPLRGGIERTDLGNGRVANTLFLEWNFDGATEFAKLTKPDAEPITLITENGRPLEIHVRSHWRVGVYNFEDCVRESGRALVVIANAFHTPVVAGCSPRVIDVNRRGGINTFVFNTVSDYARAAGHYQHDSFGPLQSIVANEIPAANHPARTQPIFAR